MFAALSILPIELRSAIANFIGIAELIRLTGPTDFSQELEIFGSYPNEIIDLARKGSLMYPVLESLGFLPRFDQSPENVAVCCLQWVAMGDNVDMDSYRESRVVFDHVYYNTKIARKHLVTERLWVLNSGSKSCSGSEIRDNISRRWRERINDIQAHLLVYRLYLEHVEAKLTISNSYPREFRYTIDNFCCYVLPWDVVPSAKVREQRFPGLENYDGM